jgi:hypothetical protein
MRRLLIRLYPARWRARYGDEFLAVLEDRPVGPFDVADILLGALDAHLHLRGLGAASVHERGFAMSSRIGGYAAIVGGLLWGLGFIFNVADGTDEAWPSVGPVVAGNVLLLVALVGLSAFQARSHPVLVWTAFLIPAVGAVLTIVGLVGMALTRDEPLVLGLSAWGISMLGLLAMIGGTGLFALATWLTRSTARGTAAFLGIASIVVLLALLTSGSGLIPGVPGVATGVGGIALYAAAWVALGWSSVRVDRPVIESPGAAA